MHQALNDLPLHDPESGLWSVVIDTPKGCRNKYKYDAERELFRLSKILPLGMAFPFDFGFLPGTQGADGDPLDVLLLMDELTFAGCVVSARLIGVIEAEQTEEGKTVRNDRLIACAETPYNPAELHSLDKLTEQQLSEIEHFFESYNAAEGRRFRPIGRRGRMQAEKLVDEATPKTVAKRNSSHARARR
jgi:inorganic pyrophosphatase